MNGKWVKICAILVVCAAALVIAVSVTAEPQDADSLLKKADKLFEKKNYKDAALSYEKLLGIKPRHKEWHRASKRVIACKLRLQLFDPAIEAAEKYIERCKGTPYEARAERFAGNLYMLVPHHGTRAGGKFHRAQWKQGIHVQSHQYDKKHALAHMERARELYAKYDADKDALKALPEEERKNWHNERIECGFDLASIYARFGIYENQWHFWYSYWGERDEFLAETAGEQDFSEYYSHWQLRRKRPTGLRVSPDGKPIFPATPEKFSKDLSDDQKILYLLKEARDLDKTEDNKYTGLSYYRQAMLARTRFGMDRLNYCAGMYYWGGKYPLKEELENYNPWELADGEAIVLVGGKIRKVALPTQWDILALLRTVVGDYSKCPSAAEAQYAVGLYHQSRQQYKTAITQYVKLKADFPESKWVGSADTQIGRIKQPQILISYTGVQLPGEPAKLQISYRNASKVWFVARKIDHKGFLEDLRNEEIDKHKGLRGLWLLRSWHYYFTGQYHRDSWEIRKAAEHVGKEVARWADEVPDDGSHRYAQKTLQTALKEAGAYLVYAYFSEPPKEHAEKTGKQVFQLGKSRAVFVLTDLAIVDKKVGKGNLYFICDARNGAPVPQANVDILHVWSVWDRASRKSIYYKKMYNLVTDKEGMALLETPGNPRGTLHVLVKAGQDRLAWSGMSYWSRYRPSRMREGLFAYCITDRPVYRPEQTVRFKAWARQMQNGILRNLPDRDFTITIYDPRGNRVLQTTKHTDQYGGFDGELVLGAEPTLGVYRIYIHGQYYVGGQNFRVEEYKKPEFEVTVEPGKTHAKLGEKVTAVIKASYYFGAPVTDATVKYNVFREEYTHSYYFPGEWDWLYGSGYPRTRPAGQHPHRRGRHYKGGDRHRAGAA
jgi:hypothetical protein